MRTALAWLIGWLFFGFVIGIKELREQHARRPAIFRSVATPQERFWELVMLLACTLAGPLSIFLVVVGNRDEY